MTIRETTIQVGALTALIFAFLSTSWLLGFFPTKQDLISATTRNPIGFTELYFENSTNLPKYAVFREKFAFQFTVHSLESHDKEYRYEAYALNGDTKLQLGNGTFSLKDNESKTITISTTELTQVRQKIVVELLDNHQIISFWIN